VARAYHRYTRMGAEYDWTRFTVDLTPYDRDLLTQMAGQEAEPMSQAVRTAIRCRAASLGIVSSLPDGLILPPGRPFGWRIRHPGAPPSVFEEWAKIHEREESWRQNELSCKH
jgi:hypothetical protein